MPAYNAESTLDRAITSTLRDMPEDAELVILDDGSTDGTLAVTQRFRDRRLRVHSRPNGGVASALNALIAMTDSEFIARMDADDIVLPGRFSRQHKILNGRSAASQLDAVFTTVVPITSRVPSMPRPSSIHSRDFALHLLLTNPVAHSTLMARRDAVSRVGGYREIPTEDYDLWLRLALSGALLHRMAIPGLAYRVHPQQVTASTAWRHDSWTNPEIAAAFADLSERLLGRSATRISSLSIQSGLTQAEKLAEFEVFADSFVHAIRGHTPNAQRALKRKLAERRLWFLRQVATAEGHERSVLATPSRRTGSGGASAATSPSRLPFRDVRTADRDANAHYLKSRLVLRWFRAAQRWRQKRGLFAKCLFFLTAGSYKVVTEGLMGIELPVSTSVGPGLRLRHGFGIVVNPATVIGSHVMLRQGVTLGNRVRSDDCPVIEDDVEIGVGAVVIGAIRVGRGAKIGPGAVVYTDVPPGCIVYSPRSERKMP